MKITQGFQLLVLNIRFKNKYAKEVEAIFSYNSKNFVDIRNGGASIRPI